ncbi:unnamed protein product [Allacma fusca]|uniref:Uncharacterized protein n=1 Tax=Allacma fusca TaxID=39272 RepID=A0A8J2P8G8_9HEXA|nr:unnamed protein product [Allacma fusca]
MCFELGCDKEGEDKMIYSNDDDDVSSRVCNCQEGRGKTEKAQEVHYLKRSFTQTPIHDGKSKTHPNFYSSLCPAPDSHPTVISPVKYLPKTFPTLLQKLLHQSIQVFTSVNTLVSRPPLDISPLVEILLWTRWTRHQLVWGKDFRSHSCSRSYKIVIKELQELSKVQVVRMWFNCN